MQYHVLLEPRETLQLSPAGRSNCAALTPTNGKHGWRLLHARRAVLTRAGPRLVEYGGHRRDRVASLNGVPVRIKDIGRVVTRPRPAPSYFFGFQTKQKNDDDAVEASSDGAGGEQTPKTSSKGEKKTEEIKQDPPGRPT